MEPTVESSAETVPGNAKGEQKSLAIKISMIFGGELFMDYYNIREGRRWGYILGAHALGTTNDVFYV
jgi:hypothetical protein